MHQEYFKSEITSNSHQKGSDKTPRAVRSKSTNNTSKKESPEDHDESTVFAHFTQKRVWVDISTLRDSADILSGIPRTVFELSYPLSSEASNFEIRFFGYDEFHHVFREYDAKLVENLHSQRHHTSTHQKLNLPPSRREILKWSVRNRTRNHLGHFYYPCLLLVKSIFEGFRVFKFKLKNLPKYFNKPKNISPFHSGDIVFSACAMWNYPCFSKLIEKEKTAKKIKTVFLIYDIIPIVQPHFFNTDFSYTFKHWFKDILLVSDLLLGISQSTVNDINSFSAQEFPKKHINTEKLLLGFELGKHSTSKIPHNFNIKNNYILTVSTIESRKNHTLLYYAWKQLLQELPIEQVPHLVIVGRPGHGSADLIHLFKHDPQINKKVHLLTSCSDSELAALYLNCLFTLYPSWYEGWGLPITESLSYGKIAITSNTSSMPEAGGGLTIQLPPNDPIRWAHEIKSLISNNNLKIHTLEKNYTDIKPRSWKESIYDLNSILSKIILSSKDSDYSELEYSNPRETL